MRAVTSALSPRLPGGRSGGSDGVPDLRPALITNNHVIGKPVRKDVRGADTFVAGPERARKETLIDMDEVQLGGPPVPARKAG